MKKLLSVLLAAMMLLAVVSAYAELKVGTYDPASAGNVELRFGWWGNQKRDAVTLEALNFFTENYPNITFNPNAQNWSNYWALMSTYASNNDLPDIMQQDYAYLQQWVEAGDLLDLTPYVESGALDVSGLSDSILKSGMVGDGLYALCAGVNAPSLLYNKTLTDSLDITVPDNMTWDEFEEISRKIFAARGIGVAYGEGNSENPLTYYARGLGYNALWDANGVLPTAEEMAGYYARLLKCVSEGWMYNTDQQANVQTTGDLNMHPLVFGATDDVRTWCAFAFSNQLAAFQAAATADGIELGIVAWPSENPQASNYMKPGQFFSVTTDTQNPDLAVAFLNYLINDPQGNIKLQAERGVPANSAMAVEIADELNKLDATYGTAAEYLAIVAENSSPIFPPLPAYAGTANDEVIKYLSDEMLAPNPGMTAEEAGAYFVENVNDLAANY
ncbi:MAG: carbohydrate ABC transporter substrate-binding protein [Clostridia bacterium]|nr:carbohydrate ABC transporter substrate-binding protein [Clostridia bacterium]